MKTLTIVGLLAGACAARASQQIRRLDFPRISGGNVGHVIHYGVATPSLTTAVFLPEGPGPQFRLTYERTDATMSGKFQMRMPGQPEWKSYLEWSDARK